MAVSTEYLRQLYATELARPDVSQGEIDYWRNTGLEGDALLWNVRNAAGVDNTLHRDPAYAAFDRYYRQKQSSLQANQAAEVDTARRQADLSRQTLADQLSRGYQKTDQGFMNRGMYRSGGRLEDRSALAGDIQGKQNQLELEYGSTVGRLNRDTADQLATLSRQRDEQEVAARNRMSAQSITDARRAQMGA